jgi:hypothetical protein
VSVHGLGAIGLLTVQMCRLDGIQNVIGVDPDRGRRKLALDFGATHVLDPSAERSVALAVRDMNDGNGVDVAIDVSGSDRGLQGALAAAGLGANVVAAGFYQGGAGNLRLGEEFHHNRLSIIASIGGWGAPNRHAPLWNRRRVMAAATNLLFTDRVSVEGMLDGRFPFDRAPEAYQWLDSEPQGASRWRSTTAAQLSDRRAGRGRLVGYGVSASSLHAPLIAAEPRLALRAVVSSDPDRVHRELPVRVVPAVADLPRRSGDRAGGRRGAQRGRTPRWPPPRCRPGGTSSWTSRSRSPPPRRTS